MTKNAHWLYLPIDVKVREIEAKSFLALRAAQRGYNIVIGQKHKFPSILSCYPAGYYLGFGAIENFKKEYMRYASRGHKIILQDEEGLVTHSPDLYARNRLRPDMLEMASLFLAWGNVHAEHVRKYRPEFFDKVLPAGNPRFDVLKPEQTHLYRERVQSLKEKHGDYILICSSFGSCNHYTGADNYLKSLKDKKVIQSEADADYYQRYFEYRKKIMQEFLKIIPVLSAEFPGYKIIVRPHPSENLDVWQESARGLGNIEIVHEGSIVPWLLAAGAIIHNFCTTSLESFAIGRDPIAYRPFIDASLETPLPTIASIEARSADDLIAAVHNSLTKNSGKNRTEKLETLKEYIANLSDVYASDSLLDRLDKMQIAHGRAHNVLKFMHPVRKIAESVKRAISGQKDDSYNHHKFGALEIGELKNIIEKFDSGARLRYKKIHHNCILISQP